MFKTWIDKVYAVQVREIYKSCNVCVYMQPDKNTDSFR